MKKKIAALLTAAFVMTMSAATVFAAASPTWDNVSSNVTVKEEETKGATEVVTNAVTLDTTKQQAAAEKAKEVLNTAETATVTAVIEISGNVTEGETATVTVTVPGVTKGDKVIVLHEVNGVWQQESASVNENGDVVITGLTSFSPFVFIKYTEATVEAPVDNGNNNTSDEPATAASPKTGVVVSVAAMTAGICLAGAAVCGKKVKFN